MAIVTMHAPEEATMAGVASAAQQAVYNHVLISHTCFSIEKREKMLNRG